MALIKIQWPASSVNFCRGPGIGTSFSQWTEYGHLLDALDPNMFIHGVIALVYVVVQVLINNFLCILLELTGIVDE